VNIEIQRASNLGDLHKKLNIDANSRISLRHLDRDGIQIWDLSTGNYFVINPLVSPMTVEQFHVEIPLWAVEIIECHATSY